ncbi:nitrogenase iron-molybdenum cofactor biosynthesis protein NifE [Methanobrevibacter filiformis]|uniref:Nitrogenase iron-molybdenum cofactor biosynthesis protein NifE n=1 Tax=Methanobrevibacter filiformis TaxID=55758 RepID=A0A166CQ21_9EURY|nr:nitrogenase iron-molybdenum cofactor biosynthesis protein NifE [Methanobrevibacter filiformis]KZX15957.1 nitrogenase molybdenum-iron protein alpha chain [Methanobrevibacter filiformis]
MEEKSSTIEPIIETFKSREKHMCVKRGALSLPECDTPGIPGTVTQRTCVFGGARIVLMPITDALHLVHGPIGCASCTWDIRGSKSSGSKLYKQGCSTDLKEKDIVFGGERKLYDSIIELHKLHDPGAIFVYATCVSGVIGDDIKSVAKQAEKITGCRVIPVQSEGFQDHNKTKGHWIGCDALIDNVIGTSDIEKTSPYDINIIGEFNVAGDLWGIEPLLEYLGLNIISTITGDSKIEDIAKAHHAKLDIVQCQKSSNYLAKKMKKKYGIPSLKVNFFGIQSTITSITEIVEFFDNEEMKERAIDLIENGVETLDAELKEYRDRLNGKTVALYVGGNKAWSLVNAFEELGMEVIMSGTKNGIKEDYENIRDVVKEGTLIVDDANSTELMRLLKKYKPNLLISGAKEKYIALKLGVAFCDFNHDRISAFAGFRGFLEFAKEVDAAVSTPVWNVVGDKLNDKIMKESKNNNVFRKDKKKIKIRRR